ncbi:MAG: right-handed parallel beta-helix repeat-containing protein [Methanosarcinaceae archaeon]
MKKVLTISLFFLFFSYKLFAATINVPFDKLTIQAGIDSARTGDIVLVQPGIYSENISLQNKNIIVGSLFLITQNKTYIDQTIIHGNENKAVFEFWNVDTTTVLKGFTITGLVDVEGIACNSSSPNIDNCIIYNTADGIFVNRASSPIISDCEIYNNSQNGIIVKNVSNTKTSANIRNCIIYNNLENGVYVTTSGSYSWLTHYAFAAITNCTIHNNSLNGVIINEPYGEADAFLRNNIISNNGEFGIKISSKANVHDSDINFNCLWGNVHGDLDGDVIENLGSNNCIYKNSNGDTCDISFNIYQEPLFQNSQYGVFNLKYGSPCINAGNPVITKQYLLKSDDSFPDIGYQSVSLVPVEATLVEGNITGIWTPDKNPYIVTNKIQVVDSIIIEAGVQIKIDLGGYDISIGSNDKFIAKGNKYNSIIFEPLIGNNTGSWNGLSFSGTADDDTLTYCIIRDATEGIGIYSTSSITIKDCEIYNNSKNGIMIQCKRATKVSATLTNCSIYNNLQNGIYISTQSSHSWLSHSAIASITNCTIYNNSENGVRIYEDGGCCGTADAFLRNNIIANNGEFGVKIIGDANVGINDINYSCFWGNISGEFENISGEGFGPNNTNYQNANGHPCDISYNIYMESLLVDATNGNFNLKIGSPCIDAGNPEILDPDNTISDIGSHSYFQGITNAYLNFSHSSLNYGEVSIGTSSDKIVTLTNTGNANLTISNMEITGSNANDFSIVSGGEAGTLTPSEYRTVTVRFAPQSEGGKIAYLEIVSNAPGSPHTVTLTGNPTIVRQPYLFLSTCYVQEGGTVTISGKGFTPYGLVELNIFGPEQVSEELTASSDGKFNYVFTNSSSDFAGEYGVRARDVETGQFTNTKPFIFLETTVNEYHITIKNPKNSVISSDDLVFVEWLDKMTRSSVYPAGNRYGNRAYSYEIQLSSDGGVNWETIGKLDGEREYEQPLTLSKLFSIPIGIGYQIKVVDWYKSSRFTVSETFDVSDASNLNSIATLEWDYSYERRAGNPLGVAADGVGRIYIKVKDKDAGSGPTIKSVTASITYPLSQDIRTSGKLMLATETSEYSDEAKDANALSVPDNTPGKTEYWFWYVAPDDFVENDNFDPEDGDRPVEVTIAVTYDGGTQEVYKKTIRVVRPPLMLVHGLGGSPETWDDFAYTTTDGEKRWFVEDTRYKVRRVVRMLPSAKYTWNAMLLLYPASDNRSFASAIDALRKQGYAANQVEYVCHSMGGCMLRTAIQHFQGLYYASNSESGNYSKGYVNRAITLDTPHNGSELANLLIELEDEVNWLSGFEGFFRWGIFNKVDYLYEKDDNARYKPTDAVNDLCINEENDFDPNDVRTHFIAGDIIPGTGGLNDVSEKEWNEIELDLIKYLVILLSSAAENDPFIGPLLTSLDNITGSKHDLMFLDIATEEYGANNFASNGDFIVSLNSQLAGLSSTEIYTSVFEKITHAPFILKKPHQRVTKSIEVGNKVNMLLNSPVESDYFRAGMPATDNNNPGIMNKQLASIHNANFQNDSERVELLLLNESNVVMVDSSLHIQVNIADTTGLAYVDIFFQDEVHRSNIKNSLFDFNLQVSGAAIDSQWVGVIAVFRYPDSTVIASDEVKIFINPQVPIQSFSAGTLVNHLSIDDVITPEYEVVFETFISKIGKSSDQLQASVNDPTVIEFDPELKTFKGISEGNTFSEVTYRGLTDTIYFSVNGNAYNFLPQAPLLSAPANGDSDLEINPSLYWQASNVNTYRLNISKNFSFSEIVFDKSDIVDTLYTVSELSPNTTYYWRVNASDSIGTGAWSDIWNFTTGNGNAIQTIPIKPAKLNMISFNITPQDKNINLLLDDLETLLIAKDDAGKFYIPPYSVNTIGEIDLTNGYQLYIKGEQEDVVSNEGTPLAAPDYSLSLTDAKLFMIGYPYQAPHPVTAVFSEITGSIVVVQNDEGHFWIPRYGVNTMGDMQPGKGYQIYVKEQVEFDYPDLDGGLTKAGTKTENLKKPTHFTFQETGAPFGIVVTGSEEELSAGDEVGVFANNLCVGAAVFNGDYPLVISAWEGDEEYDLTGFEEGEPITLIVWKAAEKKEFEVDEKFGKSTTGLFKQNPIATVSLGALEDSQKIPTVFALDQNYPNPFNPKTVIRYHLPEASKVVLEIYSVNGELVKTLESSAKKPGTYLVEWDGSNKAGISVASGLYFCRIKAGDFKAIKKLMLIK